MEKTKRMLSLVLAVLLLAASAWNLAAGSYAHIDHTAYLYGRIPAESEQTAETSDTGICLLSEDGQNILLGALDGTVMLDLSAEGIDPETIEIDIAENGREWVTADHSGALLTITSFLPEEKTEPEQTPTESQTEPEQTPTEPQTEPEYTSAEPQAEPEYTFAEAKESLTQKSGSGAPPAPSAEEPSEQTPVEGTGEAEGTEQENLEAPAAGEEENGDTPAEQESPTDNADGGETESTEPPEAGAAQDDAQSGDPLPENTSENDPTVQEDPSDSVRPDTVTIHISAKTEEEMPHEVKADFILTKKCSGAYSIGPKSFYNSAIPIFVTADETGATLSGFPAMTLCTVGEKSCYIYSEDTLVTVFANETAVFRLPDTAAERMELSIGGDLFSYLPLPAISATEPSIMGRGGVIIPVPYDWGADVTQTVSIERLDRNEDGELVWTEDESFRTGADEWYGNLLIEPNEAAPGTYRAEIAWIEPNTEQELYCLMLPFYVFYL